MRNTIITNNGAGLAEDSCPADDSFDINNSNLWGNTIDVNCTNAILGPGMISENPQYTSPPDDLHLQPSSVCIDSGGSTDAPDHDLDGNPRPLNGDGINGAEFDMGAYEFVPAGATTTTSTSITCPSGTSSTTTTVPEDTGLIPPDKATWTCEAGLAKNAAALMTAIAKCHRNGAHQALVGKTFDEEACEASAKSKYDTGNAKLFAKAMCPTCAETNAPGIATGIEQFLDGSNGQTYCAGTVPLP